ncbi:hypothetical protein GOBAR_AA21548 [Gossypium barbadense]|uniref:Uncharacterized protein n=1 Tax=Gossypium barbadense TaxID=3634 RepID=A0A2P5X712_GOSBA|nr:hypothetical protein GOBAR_AA21548 [Gossypium barbadense]
MIVEEADIKLNLDLNCGRVFGRIAFIAVADITDAIAVIAAGFGSSGFGRCRYRYITAAISIARVQDALLTACNRAKQRNAHRAKPIASITQNAHSPPAP